MSYLRAEEILPEELITAIQQYVSGKNIYIPCKEKKSWGSQTKTLQYYQERNAEICRKHVDGISVKSLANEYSLSEKSIQRILKGAGQMYYYHVVSDVPKYKGEHIILDDRHPNGVYKRVHAQLDAVKDIYRNPQKYNGVKLSHEVDVALRELALEEVRREQYSQYPSRMASLYVSKTYKEAEQWETYFARLGRPTFGIAKIRANGNCFVGDAYKCFDGTLSKEENLRMAELYWANGINEDGHGSIPEILVDGDIEIIEIVCK